MALLDIFKRKPKTKQAIQKRRYDGAQVDRLFADFLTSTRSADSEIRPAIKTLRNRCRDLARNNEYVRRYLNMLKSNVVGERGVTLQVKAKNQDNSFDNIGNTIVENAFAKWGKLGNCTVDCRMTWVDTQRIFIENLARDGEVLIRLVNYNNADNFALEFLEPDLLDDEKNEILPNGNRIRMGVEIDKYGKPVAYHLLSEHPGDMEYTARYARKHIRVPADKIIHAFMPDRAMQNRGVPFLSSAIVSLKMLHGYREAELVAARTAASKMGFFTSPAGDGFMGDDIVDGYTPIMNAEPGTMHQLPAGVDFKAFDPSHPTSAFGDFEKAVLRGIASGLGVSYNTLANDLEGVSYSSIRQGALEDRDFYRMLQSFMIQHFVEPVYRAWLQQAMTAGTVILPIAKYGKFADNAHFRGRGFPWIDPQREIQANVIGIQNGILSMQDVANNYGRDVEETFEQIALEKELAAKYGVQMAFEPFGQKLPVQASIAGDQETDAEVRSAPQVNVTNVRNDKLVEKTEHEININPKVEVKHEPIAIDLRIDTEPKTKKRKVKLVRDDKGAVLGAEIEEQ